MVHLLPGLDYAHNNIIIWVGFTNCQLITVIELTTSVCVSQAEIFCCKRSNVFHIISVPSRKIQLIYIPFLYQGCVWCVCVCVHECRHTQSCLTLCDPMDCGAPGSFAHGIFQARMLEWIVISFSWESFWSRNQTYISCISCISRWVLYQLSHQGSPIRGMCTLFIFLTKDSTLTMVGVKTLIQMAPSMYLLEYVMQWMVIIASLWSCSGESHCLSITTRTFWMSC